MIKLDSLEIKTPADKLLNCIKKLELGILEEADRICRKNNIEYSISGGTMLGAVRHGGFIPWDDDVDIELTADNYEKFIKACKKDLNTDKYELLTHETNPNFMDFPAKILLKGTIARSKSAKNANIPLTLCVDVFKLDYISDNEQERKELIHELINLRQVAFAKVYDNMGMITDPNERIGKYQKYFKYMRIKMLYKKIKKMEDKLNKTYPKSSYLFDNCIYHTEGYNGKPNFELSGYEDIKFEDITVRKFKDHHGYLHNLFGNNYMEMPPVEKRATHHRFYEFDLKDYYKDYDLPDDYAKYGLKFLEGERLVHIKNLCLDMLDEVDRICRKHDITYYLSGDDILYKAEGIEEMCKLWRKDVCIFMDRKNLEKFNNVVEDELDKKYFYQTNKTDKEYFYYYPKIRLQNTYLKDRTLIPANVNEGIWLNIGIIINTPNDKDLALKYYNELRGINDDIKFKSIYDEPRIESLKDMHKIKHDKLKVERRKNALNRIKNLEGVSLESLLEKRENLYRKYEDTDTDYVVELSTTMIKAIQMKKEDIGEGIDDTLLGRTYHFPNNIKAISDGVKDFIPARGKKYSKLRTIKEHEPERYKNATEKGAKKFLEQFNAKYSDFNLGLYDLDDYQQSVLTFKAEEN